MNVRRRFWIVIGITYALLVAGAILVLETAHAQPYVGCAHTRSNQQNNGNSFTIGGTPVQVLAASGTRCAAGLKNTGGNPVRCASASDGTPTSTNGFQIPAGDVEVLNFEGQEAYSCIETTGSSSTLDVLEAVP